jgi:hypothetical protein
VVYALASSNDCLYAGGTFTNAGGVPASCIARWNGNNWSGLGSGLGGSSPSVFALLISGSDLHAAGSFTTAGGQVAAFLARAILSEGSVLSLKPGIPGPNTNTLTFAGLTTKSYRVQFATNLTTSPWLTLSTNTANAYGRGTVLDPAATNDQRYYRVLTP